MDQLCGITETQNVSDTLRGYMLSAFSKVAVHSGGRLTPAAQELQHVASMSANPDLQQRALELSALLRQAVSCLHRELRRKSFLDMDLSIVQCLASIS